MVGSELKPAEHMQIRAKIGTLLTRFEASDQLVQQTAFDGLVEKVTITPGFLALIFRASALQPGEIKYPSSARYEYSIPFETKRRGVECRIIIGGKVIMPAPVDRNLIEVIARSHGWWQMLTEQPDCSIDRIARDYSIDPSDVTRFIPLALLAPDIVAAILDGRQPANLTVERLKKLGPIPSNWATQRRLLGFDTSFSHH